MHGIHHLENYNIILLVYYIKKHLFPQKKKHLQKSTHIYLLSNINVVPFVSIFTSSGN